MKIWLHTAIQNLMIYLLICCLKLKKKKKKKKLSSSPIESVIKLGKLIPLLHLYYFHLLLSKIIYLINENLVAYDDTKFNNNIVNFSLSGIQRELKKKKKEKKLSSSPIESVIKLGKLIPLLHLYYLPFTYYYLKNFTS